MRMSPRRMRYTVVVAVLIVVAVTTTWSFAADNTVPETSIGYASVPITANDLKPPQCANLDLTYLFVITGNGAIHGTDSNDLIIGSPGKDNIHAGAGDDCIVGGGGDDQIFGDDGTDVCIGDSKSKFHDCEMIIQ
jgi:Ca2+-binding RTX toxin-like protein